MIVSNISVPLLGLVDTAVIGHLDSPVYLGGVAIGATATSFLFMLLLFLRMSTTGLTAQAYGAKDPLRLARALVQPLILALGAGLVIVLLRTPLIDLALHIVGGSEAVLHQARRFLEIRWLSAPASLANLVLLGWLLGVQYARAPVILLVVGNLLNIVLDVWLVMGLKMNVQGAALATAIAEYATLLIGLWMVWRVLALRGISLALLKTSWRGNIRKLLALNRDIMLRSLLLQLCFGALTVMGGTAGAGDYRRQRRADDLADLYRLRAGWLRLCGRGALRAGLWRTGKRPAAGSVAGGLPSVWPGRADLCPHLCPGRRSNHCPADFTARTARAGEPLSYLAGDPAGGGRLVLSAGWHVYRCHPRGGDAQQHGGGRRRVWPDALHPAVAGQPWFVAGPERVPGPARAVSGLDLA
ncbi:Multidrug export protein mepA [Leclercia adecarboxylata]|uniref:Multidrug export protein mepA n=1 Tax=Leclercia adecarboxylata TaxID=83655 RepID=A0A4U9HEW8_9ENTR|nr:Multidrug export protein mepA [Leclercia adecarboxylata]